MKQETKPATTEHTKSVASLASASAVVASHGTAVSAHDSANQPVRGIVLCSCSGACNRKGIHRYWREKGKRIQRCDEHATADSRYCKACKCTSEGCDSARYKSDFCRPCQSVVIGGNLHQVVSKLARHMPMPRDISAYIKNVTIRKSPPVVAIIAAWLWEPWAVEAFVDSCGGEASAAAITRGLLAAITAARKDLVTE